MQALQPEMQKLQKKYKDNQQKLQEEMMKLFQKHNVNPMSGCLPILVQMPILIAFYQAIMRNDHIREASFSLVTTGQSGPILHTAARGCFDYILAAKNDSGANMIPK